MNPETAVYHQELAAAAHRNMVRELIVGDLHWAKIYQEVSERCYRYAREFNA